MKSSGSRPFKGSALRFLLLRRIKDDILREKTLSSLETE
jgi:hypothetical protein